MRVKDVLTIKGTSVATIDPGATVADAIDALARNGVGALVVTSDGRRVEGIVSERDVVRGLSSLGSSLLRVAVCEIMTSDVHTCTPADQVRSLAKTMTDKRFRHMPVVVDDELAGIMSIGDVVKSRLDELQTEHDQLVGYISAS